MPFINQIDPLIPIGLLGLSITCAVAYLIYLKDLLKKRKSVGVIPSFSLDPNGEEIARFAAAIARSLPRGRMPGLKAADAVRFRIGGNDGDLVYGIECQERALKTLKQSLFRRCHIAEAEESIGGVEKDLQDGKVRRRMELTIALPSIYPLREVPLEPDPLTEFAWAIGDVGEDERVEICVDLLPTSRRERRKFRNEAKDGNDGHGWINRSLRGLSGGIDLVFSQIGGDDKNDRRAPRSEINTAERVEQSKEYALLKEKLTPSDEMFRLQILLCVEAPTKGRAKELISSLHGCFRQFDGENEFKATGVGIGGTFFLGADSVFKRRSFDYRLRTGLFKPRRKALVNTREVQAFIKPPTAQLDAENVQRGVHAPPPRHLPRYTGQKDMLPLGGVVSRDGSKYIAGVDLETFYFSYFAGRSGYGKTELAINQLVHLIRAGYSTFYLDPHTDGVERIKSCITDIPERIISIDLKLSDPNTRHTSWNAFDMRGRSESEIGDRAQMVVSAFTAALGWGDRATRSSAILTGSCEALLYLALKMPPELAPTIYTLKTLLMDPEWRGLVKPHLPKRSAEYLEKELSTYSQADILPVVQLIDRLSKDQVRAFLGSPISTYNARRAMDEGKTVLVNTGGTDSTDKLVAGLLVYDLFSAGESRMKDTKGKAERLPIYAVFDELQAYSASTGETMGNMLKTLRKFGMRVIGLNQDPHDLPKKLLASFLTNRSLLASTAQSANSAKLIADEWGELISKEDLQGLDEYTYLIESKIGKKTTEPFIVNGISVEELWADYYKPDKVAELNAEIDKRSRPKTIKETLDELETLPERIEEYLAGKDARDDGTGYKEGEGPPHSRRAPFIDLKGPGSAME